VETAALKHPASSLLMTGTMEPFDDRGNGARWWSVYKGAQ